MELFRNELEKGYRDGECMAVVGTGDLRDVVADSDVLAHGGINEISHTTGLPIAY